MRFERLAVGTTTGAILNVTKLEDVVSSAERLSDDVDNTVSRLVEEFATEKKLNVARACDGGEVARGINADGTLVCENVAPDFAVWQQRGDATCPQNQAIRRLLPNGDAECEDAAYTPDRDVIQHRITGTCADGKTSKT